jgi:hypothetical protein
MNSDVDLGDANYKRKVQLLNDAMQEVGMGRYQWYVFKLLVGFWICAHEEFMQGPFRRHWVRLFLVRSIPLFAQPLIELQNIRDNLWPVGPISLRT